MTSRSGPTRRLISSGSPLEAEVGYSRAVRVGEHVFVAGTGPVRDGAIVSPGEAAGQTRAILTIVERALTEAGAMMADVVRYRVYVTDLADVPAVSHELAHIFREIRPAGTLVQVAGLFHPDVRVEIECDAIVGSSR